MDHKIIWRDFQPSDLDLNYFNKKINKLKEILGAMPGKKDLWFEVSRLARRKKGPFLNIIIDIPLKRKALRSVGIGENFQTALDEAVKEILIELKKYKEKILDLKRRKSRRIKENMRLQFE